MTKKLKKGEFAAAMRRAGATNKMWRRVTMKMQLDELEGYVETVERAFKEQLEREEKEPKEPPDGLSHEEFEAFYHEQSNIHFSLGNAFPSLVRRTAFIHLYSILEKGLIFLCDCAYEHGKLPESHADNKSDKGIFKAQAYLKSVGGVPFPDQCKEWEEICRMNELRNRYTHGGRTKEIPKKLLAYCEKNKKLIHIGMSKQIILKAGYCPHAIRVVRRFYEMVLTAIPDPLLE
ncbi:MAG: hypothetical protein RIC55_24400 [Pirellulaceae bacterium]